MTFNNEQNPYAITIYKHDACIQFKKKIDNLIYVKKDNKLLALGLNCSLNSTLLFLIATIGSKKNLN